MKKKTATAKSKAQKKTSVKKITRRVSSLPSQKTSARRAAPKKTTAIKKPVVSPSKSASNDTHNFMIFLIIVLLLALSLLYIVKQYWQSTVKISVPTNVATVALVGHVWRWDGTVLPDESVVVPNDADAFTLDFTGEDNALGITTDCNNGRSSYTLEEGNLTINPIASTMMFCLDSQENIFTRDLSQVESYSISGEELILNLTDGSLMTFSLAFTD